ncbi:hypothetical protein WJX79_004082 [Trebouxia sp. C0005]
MLSMPNLDEAFADNLPLVKQMVPKLVDLAKQLGKLHENGLVHQAVHQHSVLVGQEGHWQFAELDKACPKDSSLDKSMVHAGTEAPEMAQQLHRAEYYYPHPKQDIKKKYTEWIDQIEGTLKQGQVNLQLVKIVMGCLKKDPEERLTAAEVLTALGMAPMACLDRG